MTTTEDRIAASVERAVAAQPTLAGIGFRIEALGRNILASATGKAEIVLDPAAAEGLSDEMLDFVVHHEMMHAACARHRAGLTADAPLFMRRPTDEAEARFFDEAARLIAARFPPVTPAEKSMLDR